MTPRPRKINDEMFSPIKPDQHPFTSWEEYSVTGVGLFRSSIILQGIEK
jgi:hypothetical protein